jgi:hypothetical protein
MVDKPKPESEIEEGGAAKDSKRLQKVHERALDRFDAVALPQQMVRAVSLAARRFVIVPGAMWEGEWGDQYENTPRPEDDKITKNLERIENDYRQNRLTADFVPANDAADADTAQMLDGIHRADSEHFNAQQARDNAFKEALRGGFGAYRLTTEYAHPDDPDSDEQRINPARQITDADQSVYFYGSDLYDKSDAQAAFVLTRELRAIAEDKWGEGNCEPWPEDRWRWSWDWFTPETVCIAEYYEVEHVADKRITLTHEVSGEVQRFFESEIEEAELSDLEAQGWKQESKDAKRKRVHKYILNGSKVLKDCGYIAGSEIPIVPVYGHVDMVDGTEWWRGYVLKKMDPQRILNSMLSNLVETASTAPREVPLLTPEQYSGAVGGESFAEVWARGNIDRLPFLPINALRNEDGSIATAGPVGKIEPTQVQPAAAQLLQLAIASLAEDDDSADTVKANVSAEAMDLAAGRVDERSGIYLDNMRLSVKREAEIYKSEARDVYFEPGRKVDTLTMDGEQGIAVLSEPIIDKNGVFRVRNDLSQGSYKVVADVQESTTTKRQKTVRENLGVSEAASKAGAQDLAQITLYVALMNMDGEGMQPVQEFARRKLIELGVIEPTPEEQKQIEAAQQAQQQQPPDPAQQALMAQAEELLSKARYNDAAGMEKAASALLKQVQALAVGGPESAPEVPSGLGAANDEAAIEDKLAGAELKRAQARHLDDERGEKRIRMGHEIELERRQQEMAERKPDAA